MDMKTYSLKNLTYVIRYPEGFDEQKKYPVILCLHGAGARGDDIHKVMTNPFFTKTEHLEIGPFVFVAPLCSKNTWFDLWEQLETLVTQIALEPFTDRKRIYLMGASMGGYAVWQLAMSMPEYFAAIAPVCGGGMYWNAGRLKKIPLRSAGHRAGMGISRCAGSRGAARRIPEDGGCGQSHRRSRKADRLSRGGAQRMEQCIFRPRIVCLVSAA